MPHLIWLTNNDYITITYGLARTGIDEPTIIDHLLNPILFIFKQIGILVPFFVLSFILIKSFKLKINFNAKKDLSLFEYLIEFQSKSKKTLEKIEKSENLQKLEKIKADKKLNIKKVKKSKFKKKSYKRKKKT